MTADEMKSEFNLVYNNISSNQAPGIIPYEISVYLTKSQDLVQDEIYNSMESNEKFRLYLSNVIKTIKIASSAQSIEPISTRSKFFELPSDCKYIIHENVKYNVTSGCYKDKIINVLPTTHDEYDRISNNPFRFNDETALRLDTSNGTDRIIEIVTNNDYTYDYIIRYIKRLKPIFVSGCSSTDKINGISYDSQTNYDCELQEDLHRIIVENAARLALQDFKLS